MALFGRELLQITSETSFLSSTTHLKLEGQVRNPRRRRKWRIHGDSAEEPVEKLMSKSFYSRNPSVKASENFRWFEN
ncbi:uncharacterized protein LOC18445306 isoform X4 [Amborella trichopoda]|uniref:uncharacterized protein LOC18445306 isoform X4 n=1 Tax=Amborella trichopoda TaxID=13333 RepID=UPI0009C14421|nr:uncharacterized protein LOC18445306 isoform X4 [Amborella trichopoda]|eukprot:XP_020529690.1 uncharacterized protein LOC18445306 isoform X4 [Amborella trichopoda]